MGVAWFIVAERPVEGLDLSVDGKALAHCRPDHALDVLAAEAGVRPLMEFFSVNADDLAALLGEEDAEPPEIELPPEQWFPASEGLASVRGLLSALSAHPGAVAEAEAVIADLRRFEEILRELEAAEARWHLAVDV